MVELADLKQHDTILEPSAGQGAIIKAINKVLDANLSSLEQYFAGKDKLFTFFVGQIMKDTRGKANPAMVNNLLKQQIEKRK